jgi:hypothetical protein
LGVGEPFRKWSTGSAYLALPSQVFQMHHNRRRTKRIMAAAVGYFCHLPSESTNATKTKATKNVAILLNNKISSLGVDEAWLQEIDLRPEKKGVRKAV